MKQSHNLQFAISPFRHFIILIGLLLVLYYSVPVMAQSLDLEGELGAAAEKEDDNPLSIIAQTMMQVHKRMMQSDSGPATINLQKKIVADLDQLIGQARKSAGQSSSRASDRRQPSAQNPAGRPGSKPSSTAAEKPGNKPATVSSEQKPGNQSHKPDMEEMRLMMKNLWGELPPHVREQMLQTPVEEFMPKYQQLIEDYFRDLSDEKRGDRE